MVIGTGLFIKAPQFEELRGRAGSPPPGVSDMPLYCTPWRRMPQALGGNISRDGKNDRARPCGGRALRGAARHFWSGMIQNFMAG